MEPLQNKLIFQSNAQLFAMYAIRDELTWQQAIGRKILHSCFGAGLVELSDGIYICIRFRHNVEGFREEVFHNTPSSKSEFIGMQFSSHEREYFTEIVRARSSSFYEAQLNQSLTYLQREVELMRMRGIKENLVKQERSASTKRYLLDEARASRDS